MDDEPKRWYVRIEQTDVFFGSKTGCLRFIRSKGLGFRYRRGEGVHMGYILWEKTEMDDEAFQLRNDTCPVVLPERFENESARQLAMFSGMQCLPGQGDLFNTDAIGDSDE